MQSFTVTIDGETHTVNRSAVSLPDGHTLLGPDDTPDGFVSQETMDKTIARRIQNAKQNARQAALEEVPNSISDEDLAQYKAFKEINDDPEKLKEIVQNAEEDTAELNKLKTEKTNREVAEVMGWNPKVLNDLSKDDIEYKIESRTNDDGEDEQYAVIVGEDENTDLSDYAEKQWSHMKPALEATGGGSDDDSSDNEPKRFTKQSSASNGKPNKGGALEKFIKDNHEKAGIKKDE